MIAASVIGLFVIPDCFYVTFRAARAQQRRFPPYRAAGGRDRLGRRRPHIEVDRRSLDSKLGRGERRLTLLRFDAAATGAAAFAPKPCPAG